ncbi:hypothetical protein V1294_004451 [Bradyrhizobium sp. AZCC 1678]|uniref:hypothetical protein n=1 Tax=Bradyrhizobium sp. AZCC 1678 TaxID=3117030 RepID=UPI002FF3AC75
MNLEPRTHGGASGLTGRPSPVLKSWQPPWRPNVSIGFQAREAKRESAMGGIGCKIIYVMLVIVVLLIIWQFLGSL